MIGPDRPERPGRTLLSPSFGQLGGSVWPAASPRQGALQIYLRLDPTSPESLPPV